MHVLVVLGLSRGEHPSLGGALRDGLRVLPAVVVAVVLYALAVIAGTIALIVPGIWIAVACYFAAQAVVVDGAQGPAALRRCPPEAVTADRRATCQSPNCGARSCRR